MKCQHFYVSHCSQACTLGFPGAKGYKTLTVADVLAAKKSKATAKMTKAISATITAIDSDDDNVSITADVLPQSPGGFFSDSDEDTDISCCDVSAPL
jgi:hypothetical protein